MIRCPQCKNRFIFKNRLKTIFNKEKILECDICGSKFIQSNIGLKISFYFSTLIYLIFNNKLFLFLNNWINSDFISEILKIALGLIWICSCVYISQFFSKFKKYTEI